VLEQVSPAACGRRPLFSEVTAATCTPLLLKPCHVLAIYLLLPKKRKGEIFLSQLWTFGIAEGAGSSVSGGGGKLGAGRMTLDPSP